MLNETMLKKLIERALDIGWVDIHEILKRTALKNDKWKLKNDLIVWDHYQFRHLSYVFFDPNFLKALFGEQMHDEKEFERNCGSQCSVCKDWTGDLCGLETDYCWQYHAQQLAIMEPSERLKYLWEAVND